MIEVLLGLIPGGQAAAVAAAVLGALAGLWRVYVMGRRSERAKRGREALASAEARLEMHRESTKAEREAAGMTDEEARKEAMKWSRH